MKVGVKLFLSTFKNDLRKVSKLQRRTIGPQILGGLCKDRGNQGLR